MVNQKPVSVGWQTAFMIIPYAWIFAFYRIEKFRMGLVLFGVAIGLSIMIQLVLSPPYGIIATLVVTITLPIYFIRKWSREWNAKF